MHVVSIPLLSLSFLLCHSIFGMSHIIVAPLEGDVQPRLEINTFIRNDMHFSLYVQALMKMEGVDESDFSSFFQVGGIHGFPYAEYDGASTPGFTPDPDDQWAGYCTHSCVLFPTWHRPYIMLLEQIISGHAKQIASTYTTDNKADWEAAAKSLRQPYWDWASNSIPPDVVIINEQVEITAPDGQRKNVTNPLRRYNFISHTLPDPYSIWDRTLRHPTDDSPTAIDNLSELISMLKTAQSGIKQAVFTMLTEIMDWPSFSTDTAFGGGSANSLEAIHDHIHVLVGGNPLPPRIPGHMSVLDFAGFDPIFFLHHTNVDRLLTLWSGLNPKVWVTQGKINQGSWTLKANSTVDGTTDLTPFWKTETTFWNSNQLSDTQQLGYTYPECIGQPIHDPEAFKTAISGIVRELYGPQSALLSSGKYSEWTARVLFNPSDARQTFSVIFFMGEVPANPEQWLTASNFVGAHHAFVRSTQCARCDKNGPLHAGFVSLNPYILEHTNLTSLDSSLVTPLLTQQLQWRVLGTDKQRIDKLPSLDITILETPLDFTASDLPVVGKIRSWDKITQGRPGGASGKFSI